MTTLFSPNVGLSPNEKNPRGTLIGTILFVLDICFNRENFGFCRVIKLQPVNYKFSYHHSNKSTINYLKLLVFLISFWIKFNKPLQDAKSSPTLKLPLHNLQNC